MSLKTESSRRVAKSRPVCMDLYSGEYDVCDTTLSVYPHRGQA